MDKFGYLKKYFGYDTFRSGQEHLIDSILEGKDCLGIMPTGAGKSCCFQIPALMLEGITIVISPLISLMKDQVNSLVQNGVDAAFVNASLTEKQIELVYARAIEGRYKIIYVSPERLETLKFIEFCEKLEISMICVDEAHCVSQWGQDFRPSYLKINDFIKKIDKRPVVTAFTATATARVKNDIVKLLGLQEPKIVVTGFDRENLYFEVVRPKIKYVALKRYLDVYSGSSGIVYCSSRRAVDELFERLDHDSYSVTRYHAGLSKRERQENQEKFINDEKEIIIATNAFGMGIDKSNVTFVIHYNIPGDIESYYQEAGRAGRDGSNANCILFFNSGDIRTQKYFINNPEENDELSELEKDGIKRLKLAKLEKMINYATKATCLRSYMLSYFGEFGTQKCLNCSACNGVGSSIDMTIEAKKIFSCIKRMKQKEMMKDVIDVLKGNATDYVVHKAYDELSTFGIMPDVAESEIEKMIEYFCDYNYIVKKSNGALALTMKTRDVLKGKKGIRRFEKKKAKTTAEQTGNDNSFDTLLFLKLKVIRQQAAKLSSLPAFIIFNDATLKLMSTIKPKTAQEMKNIDGVGEAKFKKYGSAFLKEIIKHCELKLENADDK